MPGEPTQIRATPQRHPDCDSLSGLLFSIRIEPLLAILSRCHALDELHEDRAVPAGDFLHIHLPGTARGKGCEVIEFGREHLFTAIRQKKEYVCGFISGCLDEAVECGLIDIAQLTAFNRNWIDEEI